MAVGKITIYRVTDPLDNIGNVTDKIEFNINKDTKIENAFITNPKITPSEGIGDNQAPGQDLSGLQPTGRFEKLYELIGFISRVQGTFDDGQNAFVNIMEQWESEAKINDDFNEGRHGIQLDDLRDYDVIPVGTGTDQTGLILLDIAWDYDWLRNPPQAKFTIRLKQSRGDGT